MPDKSKANASQKVIVNLSQPNGNLAIWAIVAIVALLLIGMQILSIYYGVNEIGVQ